MKAAREIIKSDHIDFGNGNEKAITSIDEIEKWMNKYASNISAKFAEWIEKNKWNL